MQTKTIVSNKVQKCKYIGVQVDNYTATNKYPYCNVSVSFVDEDFYLKTINLESIMFDHKHTAGNVLELIEGTGGMIEKAKLTHTMRTYTTDNCAAMEKAFEENFGVSCFGQLLDLVVKEGLKEVPEIGELISTLHKVSTYLNHCPGALSLLKDDEEWLGFPTLTLLTEVPSRWNSFFEKW